MQLLTTILMNVAIAFAPCLLLFFMWGKNSLWMMGPAVLYVLLFSVSLMLPPEFAPLPKANIHAEVGFYIMTAVVILLLALEVWFLMSREIPLYQIAISQGLQLYTWICIWFVACTTLQGGK